MSGEQRQQESTAGPERPRLNAEEYRQLFEECHDAMVVTSRDGTILEANHAASEMFDWPHDRFLGMDIHERWHGMVTQKKTVRAEKGVWCECSGGT